MRSSFFLMALTAAAIAVWSCGSNSAPSSPSSNTPAATPNAVTVSIVGSTGNQSFAPNPAMVSQGGTVTFKNNDSTIHHVVLDDGSADLGEIAPGSSKTATLKGATTNFHCVIHKSMIGSINGASAPTAPEPPCDVYGYGC